MKQIPSEPRLTPSVLTGQQIGLLGGPLLCVYKLMDCLREGEKRKIPSVYWLETHDADFSEANTLTFIDQHEKVQQLIWNCKTFGRSIGDLPIDENLIAIIETLFRELPVTTHSRQAHELVRLCFQQHRTLGEATYKLYNTVFQSFPIEFFDPNERGFHEFSHPHLLREANNTPLGEACHVFARVKGSRMRVFHREENRFTTRTGRSLELSQCVLLPDLHTRSVLQDAYFRGEAYIAGIGEAHYLQTLAPSYAFHKVTPAKVIPRMSLTLMEDKHITSLSEFCLTIDEFLAQPLAAHSHKLIQKQTGIELKKEQQKLHMLKEKLVAALAQTGESLTQQHPLFNKRMREIEHSLYRTMRHFSGMLRKQLKEKTIHEQHALATLMDWLSPLGQKQERTLNWFPLWAVHGEKFLHQVRAHTRTRASFLKIT